MHTSLIHRKTTGGFTLIEVMIALSVLAMVMAASFSVYILGIRMWRNTTAGMDSAALASSALTRCTLGAGGGFGLRAAFHPVQISSNAAGWQITFVTPSGMTGDATTTNSLAYSTQARTLVYRSGAKDPTVIGRNIVASSATRLGDAVQITVRARSRVGIRATEREMSTSIAPRNRS